MYFEIKNNTKISLIIKELNQLNEDKENFKNIIKSELNNFLLSFIESDHIQPEEINKKFVLSQYGRDFKNVLLKGKEKKKINNYELSLEDLIIEIYQYNDKIYFKTNYNIDSINNHINENFKTIELTEIQLLVHKKLFTTVLVESYKLSF